jgi:hypothetical protein
MPWDGEDGGGSEAARAAFEHSLSLEDLRAVQPWAGADWDAIREHLLGHLARASYAYV